LRIGPESFEAIPSGSASAYAKPASADKPLEERHAPHDLRLEEGSGLEAEKSKSVEHGA
jgi:hypothetical protein